MKTIFRNLMSIVRRFRAATVLNILGLAVAFAAFMVIMMQVHYDRSFDRCHSKAGRIFLLELENPGTFSVILPRAFIDAAATSSPHIESATLINPFIDKIYFTVEKEGGKFGFKEAVQTCYPGLADIFDFHIVEGDRNCLQEPDKVMIPQSLARKLFGGKPAIGKAIHAEEFIWSKDRQNTGRHSTFSVGAVYRDLPGNTQVRNVIYTAMDESFARTNFRHSNYYCFMLLDDAAAAQDVVENFNRSFDFANIGRPGEKIKLTPLTDIHYSGNTAGGGNIFRCADASTPRLLAGISLLILIVAAINLANFSMALSPMRMRSINTQKVLGSPTASLRAALTAEAAAFCLAAWVAGCLIVWMIADSGQIPYVDADITPHHHPLLLLMTGGIAIAVGISAGWYPARHVTSFPPALALKGNFGFSPAGRRMRMALVSFQYIVSIGFIAMSIFVWLQNKYMRNYDTGFDKEQVAVVELGGDIYRKHHATYAERLKAYPEIEDVAFAYQKLGSSDVYMTNGGEHQGQKFQYFLIPVSWNFFNTLGISVVEGRNFSHADSQDTTKSVYICNSALRNNLGIGLDETLGRSDGPIIGFTGDIQIASLRNRQENLAFVTADEKGMLALPVSYIRFKAGCNIRTAVEHVRETLADIDPTYPFDVEFYDTIFDNLYKKEETLRGFVTLISLMAIIISLAGVFGLVFFESEYRRKEIGIRKVFGSTTRQILLMFNKTYLKVVAASFVIASPIAYYAASVWLKNFAYRTPIYWWVFLAAFAIAALVTSATVTYQNYRSATENPADSIKSE